jgi:glycosyltransferase involved in cell wall biosynthesis
MREIVRLAAGALGLHGLTQHESGWASVDAVYHGLDSAVAAQLRGRRGDRVRAVYAYDDGALESFRVARARGIMCIYDLPIPHWRTLQTILMEEVQINPEWAGTMKALLDSPSKLARKDEEILLSDQLLVASRFTQRSITAHFGNTVPIKITPYGAPTVHASSISRRESNKPIDIFFVGQLTQQKGIGYLVAALQLLDIPWRLTLAGPRIGEPPPVLDRFLSDHRCKWLGVVPHQTLLEAMTRGQLFVFPSMFDGFGLVLWEAMAAGMPIIATPHTAAPDIMTDGVEGFIVPIRDPDAIAERITRLYEDEPLRQQMATAALAAASRSGWETYEARIAAIVGEAISA